MNMYPGYNYGYSYDFEDAMGGLLGVALGVFLFVMLLVLAFAVLAYILESIALYTIAKRRGIRNPWLAWIPVASVWILGSISDQYRYVAKGKVTNRRKILLGLSIGYLVLNVFYSVLRVAGSWFALEGIAAQTGLITMFVLFLSLLVAAVAVTMAVYTYMCLYDLYASCTRDNAVLFLVLGILFGVAQPFFLFACRHKDEGMPPRREPVAQEPVTPVWISEPQTVQTPAEPVAEVPETPPTGENNEE